MNMQFPFFPNNPMIQPIPPTLEEELLRIKREIHNLNERLKKLEGKQKQNYMQKDDNFQMM